MNTIRKHWRVGIGPDLRNLLITSLLCPLNAMYGTLETSLLLTLLGLVLLTRALLRTPTHQEWRESNRRHLNELLNRTPVER